jgi:hypothetical protein
MKKVKQSTLVSTDQKPDWSDRQPDDASSSAFTELTKGFKEASDQDLADFIQVKLEKIQHILNDLKGK